MSQEKIVVVTTWQYEAACNLMSPTTLAERIYCARRLAIEAANQNITVAGLVDRYSAQRFSDVGALLVETTWPGTGVGRRQIIRYALEHLGPLVIIWVEPEKWTLVRFFREIAHEILMGSADIVIPRRNGYHGYPYWQPHWEMLINAWCKEALGMGYEYDFAFGPRALSPTAAQYFLNYPGTQKVPDRIDSNFGWLVDAARGGMRFADVPVDFRYPEEQGQLETHDKQLIVKRAQTLLDITQVMMERSEYLGV